MDEEMIEAAHNLFKAAREYRKLYEEHEGEKSPVVWVVHDQTGEGVFITDALNTELMKNFLE